MEPEILLGEARALQARAGCNAANRAIAQHLAQARRRALYGEIRRIWFDRRFVATRSNAPLVHELLVAAKYWFDVGRNRFRFNGEDFSVHLSARGRLVVADGEGIELVSAPGCCG